MYDRLKKIVYLPVSLFSDDSLAAVALVKILSLTGSQIVPLDARDSHKVLETSSNNEEFWKGVILSFTQKQARKFKTKKEARPLETGITAGVALMTRGVIINSFGEDALAYKPAWFGSSGSNKPGKVPENSPKEATFASILLSTYSYGAEMWTVWKALFSELQQIGIMPDSEAQKQLKYGVIP